MRSSHGPSKLFVGDLGDNRKSDLTRLFSKYGEISTIYIDENKHFAFVEFTSPVDAQRAFEHTHHKTLNGSKLRVEYAKPDKSSRDSRRPISRDRSPTATLYNQLQMTANRLPPMQVFRQSYYQHYPAPMARNGSGPSRGRSLTPPSFKQNSYLSPMHSLRSHDLYYHQHPTMYSDPTYYRAFGDPYLMQRIPPAPYLPSTSPPPSSLSSRAYRNMYSSSGINHYATAIASSSSQYRRSRSRSRHRASSHRNRSSHEQKHKRRTSSSSSEQKIERGPRTPPPKSSKKRPRRSHSSSDSDSAISNYKSSSHSLSEELDNQVKRSSSKRSLNGNSDRKHSKNKKRE